MTEKLKLLDTHRLQSHIRDIQKGLIEAETLERAIRNSLKQLPKTRGSTYSTPASGGKKLRPRVIIGQPTGTNRQRVTLETQLTKTSSVTNRLRILLAGAKRHMSNRMAAAARTKNMRDYEAYQKTKAHQNERNYQVLLDMERRREEKTPPLLPLTKPRGVLPVPPGTIAPTPTPRPTRNNSSSSSNLSNDNAYKILLQMEMNREKRSRIPPPQKTPPPVVAPTPRPRPHSSSSSNLSNENAYKILLQMEMNREKRSRIPPPQKTPPPVVAPRPRPTRNNSSSTPNLSNDNAYKFLKNMERMKSPGTPDGRDHAVMMMTTATPSPSVTAHIADPISFCEEFKKRARSKHDAIHAEYEARLATHTALARSVIPGYAQMNAFARKVAIAKTVSSAIARYLKNNEGLSRPRPRSMISRILGLRHNTITNNVKDDLLRMHLNTLWPLQR